MLYLVTIKKKPYNGIVILAKIGPFKNVWLHTSRYTNSTVNVLFTKEKIIHVSKFRNIKEVKDINP